MNNALKEAREKAGYTVQDISEALKIRKQYIIDLENDNLGALPGKIYIEGYQKMYYKFLDLELPKTSDDYDETASREKYGKSNQVDSEKSTFFKKSHYIVVLSTILLVITIFGYKSITTHRKYSHKMALTEFYEKQYERN